MKIVSDVHPSVSLTIPNQELVTILSQVKTNKLNEIEEIKHKINKYEQKKRAEAVFYQSLPPFKKFFAGRPPSHHQAVEYIVHVKERLKTIEKIKAHIRGIDDMMRNLENELLIHELEMSADIFEQVLQIQRGGDRE